MYRGFINMMMGSSGVNPIWDGLILGYNADNNTDDVLGANNATLVNGATYGPGKINQAFDLDGINDYILATAPTHNFSLSTTYNIWVKPDVISGTRFFMYLPSGTSGPGIGFRNGGTMTMFRGYVNFEANSSGVLTVGVWNMMTVVFKGNSFGSNNVLFYKNGVFIDSKTLTVSNVQPINLYVGSAVNGSYTDGLIDIPYIWNRQLSASEITELYNLGSGLQK